MERLEELAPALADHVERHDAHDVERHQGHGARDQAKDARTPRSVEGGDGRAEQQHGLDAVAAALDVDGETASLNHRAEDDDALTEEVEHHGRDASQAAGERGDDVAVDRAEPDHAEENEEEDGETKQEKGLTSVEAHRRMVPGFWQESGSVVYLLLPFAAEEREK